MLSDNIHHRLNRIVEELGEIYLSMAHNYPDFFEHLDNEFGNLMCKEKESHDRIIHDASLGVTHLIDSRDRMIKINRTREESLIKTVDRELIKLAGMEREIDGIEECSEDLELISLNAMVSALKAGNRGGAFPYITRELQRVSRLSAESSASIRYQGGILDREYKKFIDKIRQSQKETGQDINSVFSTLNETVIRLKNSGEEFSRQCLRLKEATESIRKPLYMIIEEVQKQDIVRQSIDHILLSLNEVEAHNREHDIEARLDSLKFSSQVYELSRFIIEDIKESVSHSFHRFSEEKKKVETIIDQLSISTARTSEQAGKDQEFTHQVGRIEQDIKSHTGKGNRIDLKDDRTMMLVSEMIDDLDEGIRRFNKLLNTIRNIHVSSRIEVVKLTHLENMDNIIISIDGTVGKMESQLNAVGHSVEEFRKASGEIINDFSDYYSSVNKDFETGFHELNSIVRAIDIYQKNLIDQVNKILKVSREFGQFSHMVDGHLSKMEILLKEIEGANLYFEEQKRHTDKSFHDLLKESGRDSWELRGDGIKKLIDKFTIFIHKKKLTGDGFDSSMAGEEEHSQASEITLF